MPHIRERTQNLYNLISFVILSPVSLTCVSVYQCLSGADILVHYGLQNLSHLTEEHLVTVCPALLNQAVLPPCSPEPPLHSDADLRGESPSAEYFIFEHI